MPNIIETLSQNLPAVLASIQSKQPDIMGMINSLVQNREARLGRIGREDIAREGLGVQRQGLGVQRQGIASQENIARRGNLSREDIARGGREVDFAKMDAMLEATKTKGLYDAYTSGFLSEEQLKTGLMEISGKGIDTLPQRTQIPTTGPQVTSPEINAGKISTSPMSKVSGALQGFMQHKDVQRYAKELITAGLKPGTLPYSRAMDQIRPFLLGKEDLSPDKINKAMEAFASGDPITIDKTIAELGPQDATAVFRAGEAKKIATGVADTEAKGKRKEVQEEGRASVYSSEHMNTVKSYFTEGQGDAGPALLSYAALTPEDKTTVRSMTPGFSVKLDKGRNDYVKELKDVKDLNWENIREIKINLENAKQTGIHINRPKFFSEVFKPLKANLAKNIFTDLEGIPNVSFSPGLGYDEIKLYPEFSPERGQAFIARAREFNELEGMFGKANIPSNYKVTSTTQNRGTTNYQRLPSREIKTIILSKKMKEVTSKEAQEFWDKILKEF